MIEFADKNNLGMDENNLKFKEDYWRVFFASYLGGKL
jgi:hypothetical protein